MNPEDFPVSRAQCDWFYQRSGTLMKSPYMLNSGWFEETRKGRYEAPNLVAEAGKVLGVEDDRLRLALANAAVRQGLRVGDLEAAIEIGAQATGLDPRTLRDTAQSDEVRTRVLASTLEFHGLKVTQRPTFVLEDPIGDRAVFSGLVSLHPLVATVDAMMADTRGYEAFKAHFGAPPKA